MDEFWEKSEWGPLLLTKAINGGFTAEPRKYNAVCMILRMPVGTMYLVVTT